MEFDTEVYVPLNLSYPTNTCVLAYRLKKMLIFISLVYCIYLPETMHRSIVVVLHE